MEIHQCRSGYYKESKLGVMRYNHARMSVNKTCRIGGDTRIASVIWDLLLGIHKTMYVVCIGVKRTEPWGAIGYEREFGMELDAGIVLPRHNVL